MTHYLTHTLRHKSGPPTWCVLERHSSKVLSTHRHAHEAELERVRLERELGQTGDQP